MSTDEDDMIICRCEEITIGEIKKAIREGAKDPDAVKRMTRAGMGLCQNKTCYNLIASILRKETGVKAEDIPAFTFRPPVRPVPVASWEQNDDL